MNYEDILKLIKKHEGYSDKVYLDSEGNPTGGYGHAFLLGSKIPSYVAEKLLYLDITEAYENYRSLGLDIDTTRKGVIINMLFNLGLTKFLTFKRLIQALHDKNYTQAAIEMLDSKWATQVKTRAVELSRIMSSGDQH